MVKEKKEKYIFINIIIISLSIIILLFTNSYFNFYNFIRIAPSYNFSSFKYVGYLYRTNDNEIFSSQLEKFNPYDIDYIKSNINSVGFVYVKSYNGWEYLAIKSKIMLRQDLLFKTKPRNKDEVYKAIYSDMESCINDWIYKELCEENDENTEILSPYFNYLGKSKINDKTQFSRLLYYKYIIRNETLLLF